MTWASELFENIFTIDESCSCEACKDDYKVAKQEGRPIEPIRARVILKNDLVLAILEKNKEIKKEVKYLLFERGLSDLELKRLWNERKAKAFDEFVEFAQKEVRK